MSILLDTGPTVEPITTVQAKSHLVLDSSFTADDALILGYIQASREYCEKYLNMDLVQRTWAHSMDCFPGGSAAIELPKNPVLSISSITYQDVTVSPSLQTLASSVYGLDRGIHPAEVYLQYGQSWPAVTRMRNSVTITFVSGHAEGTNRPIDFTANIPESIKSAIKLIVGDLYRDRESTTDMQRYSNRTVDNLLDLNRNFR